MNFVEMEKPHRDTAVRHTDPITVQAVPILRVTYPLVMLEMVVPEYIIIVIMPAEPIEAPNSPYIEGQAAPRTESGRPSDMNAIYMRTSRKDAISLKDLYHSKIVNPS